MSEKLERMARRLLSDPALFSRYVVGRALRPYQLRPARAILDSVIGRRGDTISVMMARQAGKNEVSAQVEAYLMNLFSGIGGQIVKAAPTRAPQALASRARLEEVLENPLNRGEWRREMSALRLGKARCLFLSAEPGANVVGATASLLLEIDEAQDVATEKYDRDFAPMAASTNATRVFYGTAWADDDLLQRARRRNLELERADGRQRHFEVPWEIVAETNPAYARHVEGERARLGESHPLFQTQYCLRAVSGQSALLSGAQRAMIVGDHLRRHIPDEDATYVAGIDVGGGSVTGDGRDGDRDRDATVVTIARVWPLEIVSGIVESRVEIVDHLRWIGQSQVSQYEAMLAAIRDRWRCSRVVIDATGLGAGVSDFLRAALGDIVQPFVFTAESKSRLGFHLLAAINGGRFRMYREDSLADGCAAEFWRQFTACRATVAPNQRLGFSVLPAEGHDDFVISGALCAWAARGATILPAAAMTYAPIEFADGRY